MGIVSVVNGNDITIALPGAYVDTIPGLTANTKYYLDTDGSWTTTAPSGAGNVIMEIFHSNGTGSGNVTMFFAQVVGSGAHASTHMPGGSDILQVSATDKILGRATAGAGNVEEITFTSAARALTDDVDAAAQRVTLGLGTVATLSADNVLPWLITIDTVTRQASTIGFATVMDASPIGQGYIGSTGTQNDEIVWPVVLAAGTWSIAMMHWINTNRGIYSLQFDTVEKGTIDGYGVNNANIWTTVSGIVVATTGKVNFKVKMATKNGSSSGYLGIIQAITFVRTA